MKSAEQIVLVLADVLRLIERPLIGRLRLQTTSSVCARCPSSDTTATSTANTAMVNDTGARLGFSRACSACSCNS